MYLVNNIFFYITYSLVHESPHEKMHMFIELVCIMTHFETNTKTYFISLFIGLGVFNSFGHSTLHDWSYNLMLDSVLLCFKGCRLRRYSDSRAFCCPLHLVCHNFLPKFGCSYIWDTQMWYQRTWRIETCSWNGRRSYHYSWYPQRTISSHDLTKGKFQIKTGFLLCRNFETLLF